MEPTGDALARVLPFRRREEAVRPDVLAAVRVAVAGQRLVVIDYVDAGGAATTRAVEPAGLVRGLEGWYLVGWCRLRGAGRSFRLDRVVAAHATDERVPRHAVRDLEPDIPAGCGAAGLDA